MIDLYSEPAGDTPITRYMGLPGMTRQRGMVSGSGPGCAVAAHAGYLVAGDRDLLDLGKPFGIAMVTSGQFLRCLEPIL